MKFGCKKLEKSIILWHIFLVRFLVYPFFIIATFFFIRNLFISQSNIVIYLLFDVQNWNFRIVLRPKLKQEVWCIFYSFLLLMQNEQIHSIDNLNRLFWQVADDSVTFAFLRWHFRMLTFDLCLSEFDSIWFDPIRFDLSWSSPLNSTQIRRWKCLNQNGIGKAKSIVCRKFWSKMHWIARLMLARARWATQIPLKVCLMLTR